MFQLSFFLEIKWPKKLNSVGTAGLLSSKKRERKIYNQVFTFSAKNFYLIFLDDCFKNLRAEKCMKMHNVHAEIVFLVCFVTFLLFRIPVLASHVPLYLSPDLFWPFNREEKSLRHVVMVAKFLDDNKPKTSPTKWIRTSLNFIHLIQFYLIWQMLATFSQVKSERTVFKFRKRKRQHLCCVHPLHKTSVWN